MTETMNRKLHCFAFKSNNKCNYEYKGNEHKKSNGSHKCTQRVERAGVCVCVCDVGCIIESVPTIDWQLKLIIAES